MTRAVMRSIVVSIAGIGVAGQVIAGVLLIMAILAIAGMHGPLAFAHKRLKGHELWLTFVVASFATAGFALSVGFTARDERRRALLKRLATMTGWVSEATRPSVLKDDRMSRIEVVNALLFRFSLARRLRRTVIQAGVKRRVGEVLLYVPLLALVGLLAPEQVEESLGEAEVRALFRASRLGVIAGCMVTRGVIRRNSQIRVVREGAVIYETTIASLKRFKDDVREVQEGFECGILLENFNDVKEGDVLEAYETRQVERTDLEVSAGNGGPPAAEEPEES